MPQGNPLIVELRGVSKDHRGLRPLRVEQLELRNGESLALLGFDQVTAEVLVNLIIGATVPDKGEINVLGQRTSDISDVDVWLRGLDRFGILTDRAVLLDALTAEQNLTLPFSLELDSPPSEVRSRVWALAAEVGVGESKLRTVAGELGADARLRVRLGRALALDPLVLLAEHPNAPLSPAESERFAADLARIVAARGIASLVLTADRAFARSVASRVLALKPATGELRPASRWSGLFL